MDRCSQNHVQLHTLQQFPPYGDMVPSEMIYYTKELGVREARDKEAFLLAATLPKSLTLYPTLRRPKLA